MIKKKKARPTLAGLYTERQIVGALAKINSYKVGDRQLRGSEDVDQEFNISEVKFHVDQDGKLVTAFRLSDESHPDYHRYYSEDQFFITEIMKECYSPEVVTVGNNGNWFVKEYDTFIKATDPDNKPTVMEIIIKYNEALSKMLNQKEEAEKNCEESCECMKEMEANLDAIRRLVRILNS